MRSIGCLFTISFLVAATAVAQQTSFPVGPQYLIPASASPLFLQPIATPTLSLQSVPAPPAIAFEAGAVVPASPEAPGTLPGNLFSIYYGYPAPGEKLATSAENGAETAPENPQNPIEISSSPLPVNLPSSVFDVGVTGILDPQTLRESGYGLSLADAASFWKAHKTSVSHVYTNADVARLHGG